MLLLAIDTSGKDGSIALAQCGPAEECKIIEMVPLAGGAFSAQLVPQIAGLLGKHGFRKEDIGGFAVASGPGSFTGLRVGLAAIKALAEVLMKPVAAVSLLEAVAAASPREGRILAALDAGRSDVYVSEYGAKDGTVPGERLLTREEFLNAVKNSALVTPDKSVADVARSADREVEEIGRPQSDAIARLGWQRIRAGQVVAVEGLDANYIRHSDAEIFAKTNS